MLAVRGVGVRSAARHLGGGHVHFTGDVGQAVVFLRNRRGAESVGLDQVGAGGQVLAVDLFNHVGPGQYQ